MRNHRISLQDIATLAGVTKMTVSRYIRSPKKVAKETGERIGNDSNLLIVFYVQIMPDDLVMQLHRF